MRIKRFFEKQAQHDKIRSLDLSDDDIRLQSHRIFTDDYNGCAIDNYLFGIYLKNEKTLIGFCDLRVGDQNALLYLGNVGYSIFSNYRGHHYAYKATVQLLKLAQFLGVEKVSITCNPDNEASIRTIIKLGGKFITKLNVPASEPLFAQGDYEKNIYHVEIKGDYHDQ